ncbi:hypothetical protein QL285_052182 [Trifolium repens]|nr:hypothetical protein QL285_052182 [Trifolium repens]
MRGAQRNQGVHGETDRGDIKSSNLHKPLIFPFFLSLPSLFSQPVTLSFLSICSSFMKNRDDPFQRVTTAKSRFRRIRHRAGRHRPP